MLLILALQIAAVVAAFAAWAGIAARRNLAKSRSRGGVLFRLAADSCIGTRSSPMLTVFLVGPEWSPLKVQRMNPTCIALDWGWVNVRWWRDTK